MSNIGRNDPCHCGSGKKFKKCHGAALSAETTSTAPQARSFHAQQDFKDPGQLVRLGPVIKGAWTIDPEEAQRRDEAGVPGIELVGGYYLIDTGAQDTSIDADVATELRLTPTRQQRSYGSSGPNTRPVYSATMFLDVKDSNGANKTIKLWKEFAGITGLREFHDKHGLKTADGSPLRVIGLLGRDFLQFTTLTYNGMTGSWDMEIDSSVLPNPAVAIK